MRLVKVGPRIVVGLAIALGALSASAEMASVVASGSNSQDVRQPGDAAPPESIIAQGDGAQAQALSDGIISPVEYQAAIEATLACVTSAGLPARVLRPHERSTAAFVVEGERLPEDAGEVVKGCMARSFHAVSYAWSVQHRPSEAEIRHSRQQLEACLGAEAMSWTNGSPPGAAEIAAILRGGSESEVRAFFECARRVESETGIAP